MLAETVFFGTVAVATLSLLFTNNNDLEFPPSYYDNLKKERIEKYGKNFNDYFVELGFFYIGCICKNNIKDIAFYDNYLVVYFEINGESYSKIDEAIPKMEKETGYFITYENIPYSKIVKFTFFYSPLPNIDFKFTKLLPHEVLIGHDECGKNIIANMKLTPHILFSGLSGRGKTGCVRVLIKNLLLNNNADVILLNGYSDDYEGFNIKHIIKHDDIKIYLKSLVEAAENGIKRYRPLYIVFEELGKVEDKELIKYITKLLQYGRHSDIYMIGVIPQATKEDVKFKTLFNTRISFSQIEETSYRVILGCSVPKLILKNREFYMVSDDFYFGKTFTL